MPIRVLRAEGSHGLGFPKLPSLDTFLGFNVGFRVLRLGICTPIRVFRPRVFLGLQGF